MLVVIWEPKKGNGGGHRFVSDESKADAICWEIYKYLMRNNRFKLIP
jgi:hypothetical protein